MVVLATPTADVSATAGDDFGRRAAATHTRAGTACGAIHPRPSARPQSQLPLIRIRLSPESKVSIELQN
jgi:hypothetical protein